MIFLKTLYQYYRFLGNAGSQKWGHFSLMKYFGFMLLTRSVSNLTTFWKKQRTNRKYSKASIVSIEKQKAPKWPYFSKRFCNSFKMRHTCAIYMYLICIYSHYNAYIISFTELYAWKDKIIKVILFCSRVDKSDSTLSRENGKK